MEDLIMSLKETEKKIATYLRMGTVQLKAKYESSKATKEEKELIKPILVKRGVIKEVEEKFSKETLTQLFKTVSEAPKDEIAKEALLAYTGKFLKPSKNELLNEYLDCESPEDFIAAFNNLSKSKEVKKPETKVPEVKKVEEPVKKTAEKPVKEKVIVEKTTPVNKVMVGDISCTKDSKTYFILIENQNGLSATEIAKKLDYKYDTVYDILKSRGIQPKLSGRVNTKVSEVMDLVKKGLNVEQITLKLYQTSVQLIIDSNKV